MFKVLYRKFTQDNVHQILSESTGFCGRYDINILVCIFPVRSVFLFYSFYNQVTTCTMVASTEVRVMKHTCAPGTIRMKHIPQSLSQWSLH